MLTSIEDGMYQYIKGRNQNASRMLSSYNNQGDDGNSDQSYRADVERNFSRWRGNVF